MTAMAKKSLNIKTAPKTVQMSDFDPTTVPILYVDQMTGLQLGPFMSKITFAVQRPDRNGDETMTPSLFLTIPTNQLLDLANNIFGVLSEPGVADTLASQHGAFRAQIPSDGIGQ